MNQTANTLDGRLESIDSEKLAMTCREGKRHDYTMARDAEVTCDGKAGRAADLKVGTTVRVTEHKDDKTVATAVRAGTGIPTMG